MSNNIKKLFLLFLLEELDQDCGHYLEKFSKQFFELVMQKNIHCFKKLIKRIEHIENLSKPIIICNEEHRFIVGDQMRKIKQNL